MNRSESAASVQSAFDAAAEFRQLIDAGTHHAQANKALRTELFEKIRAGLSAPRPAFVVRAIEDASTKQISHLWSAVCDDAPEVLMEPLMEAVPGIMDIIVGKIMGGVDISGISPN